MYRNKFLLDIQQLKWICSLTLSIAAGAAVAQNPAWPGSRIQHEIDKLGNSGSVLYIAAHPDDENTRLITWLANEKKMRTAYLSLTRGDGGQNLVGEEQGAYLGVIRTQELLAARRTDGGEQFFTRAVDFGYSKSAAETFTKWPKDSILSDMVWVIRNFRPDIIITRFPADERAGHGHHTASAMLAEEAFMAAADPARFPEQLQYVSVWQVQRMFWNNSTWWDKQLQDKIANSEPNLASIDVGGYAVSLGKSYGEIAAESRTNHKSQGFGSAPARGEQKEYLELKKGLAFTNNDIFSGLDVSWQRYAGGTAVEELWQTISNTFDDRHPERSIDQLIQLRSLLQALPQDPIVLHRIAQTDNIIAACLGLYLEPAAVADKAASGENIMVVSTAIRRLDYPVTLESIGINGVLYKAGEILPVNIPQADTFQVQIPAGVTSNPYWLEGDYTTMFDVANRSLIGKAENDPTIVFQYHLRIGNTPIVYDRGVIYKETDAVRGEIIQPLAVVPPAFLQPQESLILFTEADTVISRATLTSNVDGLSGYAFAVTNNGFIAGPGTEVADLRAGESIALNCQVQARQDGTETGELQWYFIPGKGKAIYDSLRSKSAQYGALEKYIVDDRQGVYRYLQTIDHDHIPVQQLLEHAEVHLARVQTPVPDMHIAYVEGAGDKVDESLRALSLHVTTVRTEAITAEMLAGFDAVIVGVRAYNTEKAMIDKQPLLMQYVEKGGTLIVQYSTSWDAYVQQLGPFPFKVSRTRVTDEYSPVDFLLPEHRALQVPNKLSKEDFNGWVQERGIYFAAEADPAYQMPLAFQDPGEQMQSGALLIAEYGKGVYVYTGLAFFRQLPAGVPGAYRLFINLLSL